MISLYSLTLLLSLTINNALTLLPFQVDSSKLPVTKTVPGVFMSEWEQATAWEAFKKEETIQYSCSRLLSPQELKQLSKSEVVVFIRGYQFKNSSTSEKPLSLPFYFFMPDSNALQPVYWNYTASSEDLVIKFQAPLYMEDKLTQTDEKIQYCYFLLDKAYMKKIKLTTKDLKKMSYQQLVTLTTKKP